MNFYQILDTIRDEKDTHIVTVVRGNHMGEKAILSGDKVVWSNRGQGVIAASAGQKQLYKEDPEIFIEELQPECKLVICGSGNIANSMIRIGTHLDFHIIVIDDRPLNAYEASECGAHEVICKPFVDALEHIPGDENTYFLVATRGHHYDIGCLEVLMHKKAAYIGLMSSRARAVKIKDYLRKAGAEERFIDFLHSPVGFSIGSETPYEIAVSILAELIRVRHKSRETSGYSKTIMADLFDAEKQKETRTLATIIGRKGSAPRKKGTKMIIYGDGSSTGTLGGGALEQEVIRRGRAMIRNHIGPALLELDMTGRGGTPEDMFCGGVEQIFLELLDPEELL